VSIADAAEPIRNEVDRVDVLVSTAGDSHVGVPERTLQQFAHPADGSILW
jgi:hypothetical protein